MGGRRILNFYIIYVSDIFDLNFLYKVWSTCGSSEENVFVRIVARRDAEKESWKLSWGKRLKVKVWIIDNKILILFYVDKPLWICTGWQECISIQVRLNKRQLEKIERWIHSIKVQCDFSDKEFKRKNAPNRDYCGCNNFLHISVTFLTHLQKKTNAKDKGVSFLCTRFISRLLWTIVTCKSRQFLFRLYRLSIDRNFEIKLKYLINEFN